MVSCVWSYYLVTMLFIDVDFVGVGLRGTEIFGTLDWISVQRFLVLIL